MQDFLQRLKGAAAERKFYATIKDDHVLDEGFTSNPIEPNQDYFQIRLSEMFLRDRREYWREFVPLGIVASEFIYGGQRRSFPFFVGSGLLKGLEEYVEGEQVEYRNTRVVGPIPYRGDDVGLFVGLYRVQVSDLAKSFFSVLEKIIGAFDITKLSKYLDIAEALGKGLSILLNIKAVEYRLGMMNVFSDLQEDPNPLRDSYLAYVNCNKDKIGVNDLWVKEGCLYFGSAQESSEPFRKYDYCLVRIQGGETRSDYTTFPFDRTWRKAKEKLFSDKDKERARQILSECYQQIANSTDLTEDHAYKLIQTYEANYQKALEVYEKWYSPADRRSGEVQEILTPQAAIQKTVISLDKYKRVQSNALRGLWDLSENWNRIPHLEGHKADFNLTDEILNAQLRAIAGFSKVTNPDPKALADAIAVAALSAD